MITQRNSPQFLIPGRIWFPSLCAFWKLNSFHVPLKEERDKIAMLQALLMKMSYLRCLLFWTKSSRKHFWWLRFMTYTPECCHHGTAICHHFFFWSSLAHVPCSIALWILFNHKEKFIPSQNSCTYTHREVLK